MNNKIPYIIGGIIILVLFAYLLGNSLVKEMPSAVNTNSQPTSTTANVTPTLKPENIVPGLYPNPIKNTSTEAGFSIVSAIVENNADNNGKIVSDHLEITLKNITNKDLTDFEIYYLITDTVTNKKEGYAAKLAGFTLKGGGTQTIHFDNKQLTNHFEANANSLYYTSANKLLFDIMLSTPSSKVEAIQVTKDAGGAELKD